MKRFIFFSLITLSFIIISSLGVQAQQQNLRTTAAPQPQPQDSITKLSVRFMGGVLRNGAVLQITSLSVRSTLQLYGITDNFVKAQFPDSPDCQQIQTNELGEKYSTPDLSKIALIVLPNPKQASAVMQSLRGLAEVSSVSPNYEPQIEKD